MSTYNGDPKYFTYGAGGITSTGTYTTNNTNYVMYAGDPTEVTIAGGGGALTNVTTGTGAVNYLPYHEAIADLDEEEDLWNS